MSVLKIPVRPEDHGQGDPNAECTLIEYGDYECSYCGRAHPIVKKLQEQFGERLFFVFRNFPLSQHLLAEAAAELAEYAGAHGKFWEMHDRLFSNQDRMGRGLLDELVLDLNLDPKESSEALEHGMFRVRVREDFSGGVRSGVNRAPTFFINGLRHDDPPDFEHLVQAIDKALVSPTTNPSQ